jgi:release factor glutamine methyltransferase
VTESNQLARLGDMGIAAHEARWLLEEFEGDALWSAAERRVAGEPLQYIIGHWPFRSLDLLVDHRALIPRPESEELVGYALEALAELDVRTPVIVDLGCGTGALGLSILDELRSRGVSGSLIAVDASRDALAIAKENALRNNLLAVSFVNSSWYEALDESLQGHVDLIVSNPPYVSMGEYEALNPVLDFEPLMALVAPDFAGVPGFADVAAIITDAPRWLKPRGLLVMEHSHLHREAALNAARAAGFRTVRDENDLAGQPRILVAAR